MQQLRHQLANTNRIAILLNRRLMDNTITNSLPITITDVHSAYDRIKQDIHCTPVYSSTFLNKLTGYDMHFKCENFQKTGSFKVLIIGTG